MHVEDSYEGALLRMQRLEQAGLALAPPDPRESEDALFTRMAELEQLAALACDDNERLKTELTEARDLIVGLERKVAMLEAGLHHQERLPASPPAAIEPGFAPAAAMEPAFTPAVDPGIDPTFDPDSLDFDPSSSLKPERRGLIRFLLAAGAIGGVALAVVALQPRARPQLAPVIAAPPPAPAPIATPTPPTPPATVTPPAPAPVVAPPAAPAVQAVAARRHSAHRHAAHHKHHAVRKPHHASRHVAGKHWSETSDPLGGLNL